jgi:hypothetical protein
MGGASADRRPVKGNSKHRGPTRCLHGWGQWGPFDGGWDGGPLERERPWAAHRLLHAAVTAEGCAYQIAMLPPSLLCRSPGRFLLVVSAEGRVSAASDPIPIPPASALVFSSASTAADQASSCAPFLPRRPHPRFGISPPAPTTAPPQSARSSPLFAPAPRRRNKHVASVSPGLHAASG